jgi:hypothetical protein
MGLARLPAVFIDFIYSSPTAAARQHGPTNSLYRAQHAPPALPNRDMAPLELSPIRGNREAGATASTTGKGSSGVETVAQIA